MGGSCWFSSQELTKLGCLRARSSGKVVPFLVSRIRDTEKSRCEVD